VKVEWIWKKKNIQGKEKTNVVWEEEEEESKNLFNQLMVLGTNTSDCKTIKLVVPQTSPFVNFFFYLCSSSILFFPETSNVLHIKKNKDARKKERYIKISIRHSSTSFHHRHMHTHTHTKSDTILYSSVL